MLTHFRKMAPFCIVDILIPLFPGVRGFTAFKKNEIIDELNVC